jgi:chromosome partitioning protein
MTSIDVSKGFFPDSAFVSRETWDKLGLYADLVRKWQTSINLISPKTLPELWQRHMLDSLQLYRLKPDPVRWLDMGSGAGFPGLVTAICLAEHQQGWVHLVESNNKKAAFLRQVIVETGARASVHPIRIEDARHELGKIDAISARALASLPDLLAHSAAFADDNPNIEMWFHKGLDYLDEVRSARDHWGFDLVEHQEPSAGWLCHSADQQSVKTQSEACGSISMTHAKNRIITIANQKGGVGKTTTAINLATALAAIGEEVLIVDIDPQGNASTGLGIDRKDRGVSAYDLLTQNASISDTAIETAVPHLSIIPSTMDLLGVEMEIAGTADRVFRLRKALQADDGRGYNYILIDCPPSLNLLTMNAMAAAHSILVPLQCEFFALEGLSQLLETVEQVRDTLNPALDIQGIVMTMYDSRNNLALQVVDDVRAHLGDKVYRTLIPRNVRVSEAPSYGKPAILYDLKCAGSQAYLQLASEVIQRERNRKAA